MLEVPPVKTAELGLRNVQRLLDLVCGGNLRPECLDNLRLKSSDFLLFLFLLNTLIYMMLPSYCTQ